MRGGRWRQIRLSGEPAEELGLLLGLVDQDGQLEVEGNEAEEDADRDAGADESDQDFQKGHDGFTAYTRYSLCSTFYYIKNKVQTTDTKARNCVDS
jgi:hypothetical protein